MIFFKVVEDLNELLRSWWTWIESFFCLKRSFCLGLKWMLESLQSCFFFPPLSTFIASIDEEIWAEIEPLKIIKRALNTAKKSWKLVVMEVFITRGRLMGSTSVVQNRKLLFYIFSLHSNRGRLMESTPLVCQSKIAYRSALFDRSRLIRSTKFFKLEFLSTYPFKKYKITSNRL